MEYYKLRVDTDDKEKFREFLLKYTDKYLFAMENKGKENTHIHAYMETTTKQATLRTNIRKRFGSGNGVYSLKELDAAAPVEYLAYCIKEDKSYDTNLSPEVIDLAKEYDFQVKKEIKEKKANRKTILQKIQAEYEFEIGKYDADQIITIVIQYTKDHELPVREFAMLSQVQTLLLKYSPEYFHTLSCNLHKGIDKTRM